MRSPLPVLVVLLVLASGVAPVSAAATADGTAHDGIHVNSTVSLTPDTAGEVRVETAFDLPDALTSLTVRLPEGTTVRSMEGFRRSGDHSYEWDRVDDSPSLTYDLPANRTTTRTTSRGDVTGYLYADVGEWALIPAPSFSLSYSGVGRRVDVERSVAVAGEGATGGQLVYLGPSREYAARVDGQRIRLVVPAAADMTEHPREVLDTLVRTAERIRFGARDPEVFFVAAPSTVPWATTGLQRGADDAWVRDRQRLDTPENVWVHEYVHTRQEFTTEPETRWTTEGMADYYSALLALESGHIDYDRFRRHLEIGRRSQYDSVALADPGSWEGTQANYWKGALTMAALDRQIRLAGDGTLQDVVARTNDGRISQAELLAAVEAAANEDVSEYLRSHTETTMPPRTWSRAEHAEAFGGIPAIDYSFASFRVSGPYRNRSYDSPPTLVAGERLEVVVTARNWGDRTGEYSATLTYRGADSGTRTGSLAPGERTTLSWTLAPDVGGGVIGVGGISHELAVERPAAATVESVDVPQTAAVGDPVSATIAVTNPHDRPAERSVAVRADGVTVARLRFQLAPGETGRATVTTTFDEPGDRVVTAGGESATVRVGESGAARRPGPSSPGSPTSPAPSDAGSPQTATNAGGPGFGALAALAALLVVQGIALAGDRE